MVADWTGTSPQVKGAINNTLSFTKAASYTAIRSVLPEGIPNNEGVFRAIEVKAPAGTIANAVLPAACAARGLTGLRMTDCCFGALAMMLPDRVPAASDGGATCITIGGYYADRRPFIYADFTSGTWGGRPWADGLEGNAHLFANLASHSIEVTEAEQPIQILGYEYMPDRGGPGKYRGGAPFYREYRFLEGEAILQVRSDRRYRRSFGLYGGRPGKPSLNVINPDSENRILPSKFTTMIKRGDIFRHEIAGPGGWGDPLEREPWRVLRDLRNELISAESARRDYGVVVNTSAWIVDEAETRRLRERMRARRGGVSPASPGTTILRPIWRPTDREESRWRVPMASASTSAARSPISSCCRATARFTPRRSRRASMTTPAPSSTASPACSTKPRCAATTCRKSGTARPSARTRSWSARARAPGLIGTAGFRDVLDIRTLRMPRLYDLRWEKPAPLVERYLRVTVDERVDARGRIQKPLDPADAERAVRQLLAENVEAIAICLINSFANPAHELAIKRDRRAPGASGDRVHQLRGAARNQGIRAHVHHGRERLPEAGGRALPAVAAREPRPRAIGAPILLMQSSGGLTTDRAAIELPVHIVESGPAGGVIGSQVMADAMGLKRVISFDMGGTTAKASLIEDGGVTRVHECEVGGGVIAGSRLLTGAGYTLKVPAIDLAEVGAGGGSIIWIDAGGSMRVGPNSAGATPGPVCYDLGGLDPTITDANVVLGYINPDYLVGGSLRLNAAKSRQAIEQKAARPLGLSVEHAAYGAHQIAAANMIRAIKSVSTERGRDPREYVLFAFGGNGPLFAAGMAAALDMKRIVVPPVPGLFSSFGLLCAKVEHHYSRTFRRLLRQVDLAELNAAWNAMVATAKEQLAAEGFSGAAAELTRSANLHYQGQTFELTVSVPDGAIDRGAVAAIEEAFGREHERTYGHRAGPDEPVELVTILVTGHGLASKTRVPERIRSSRAEPKAHAPRQAYFGPETGWLPTPVIGRSALSATPRPGPLIVEEYDATCLVPPSARATARSPRQHRDRALG